MKNQIKIKVDIENVILFLNAITINEISTYSNYEEVILFYFLQPKKFKFLTQIEEAKKEQKKSITFKLTVSEAVAIQKKLSYFENYPFNQIADGIYEKILNKLAIDTFDNFKLSQNSIEE